MIPAVVAALAAISAGAVAGRKLLRERISKQKHDAIAVAAALVQERIHTEAGVYVAEVLKIYLRNTLIKLGLLAVLVGAAFAGALPPLVSGWALALLFAAFFIWDGVRLWPIIRLVVSELRRNGWRPRQTLAELVAARVFDQVLTEARAQKPDWWSDLALRASGQNAEGVSLEIAAAVADIARKTSWDDLKPFVISGVSQMAGLVVLYSGAAFLMVKAVG